MEKRSMVVHAEPALSAQDSTQQDKKGEITAAEAIVRLMDFDETEIVLNWARDAAKARPLTQVEQRLRRLVFAQHCLLFTNREQHRELTRREHARNLTAGIGILADTSESEVRPRDSSGTQAEPPCLANGSHSLSDDQKSGRDDGNAATRHRSAP